MVKPIDVILAALAIIFTCIGCTATDHSRFSNAKVLELGSEEDSALCHDFRLTEDQSVQLLNQSKLITAKEMHDHYSYLPCYVKGSVTYNSRECEFTIRAGGTAELICDDDKSYILACDDCNDLLKD